jgi:hypothetical protein
MVRNGSLLRRVGALPTSGARAAAVFALDGVVRLAAPQLACDIPGSPALMQGGDSDTELLLFRWDGKEFVDDARLPAPGGEDAEFFTLGAECFLAVASARRGKGPYEPNIDSVIYRRVDDAWAEFQRVPGFFAKQWRHFRIKDREFLALALGVTVEGAHATNPSHSMIFEYDGSGFVPFQTLDGPWGYNWCHIAVDGHDFLAYADHVAPSRILEWDGAKFVPFQTLERKTGRAFELMRIGDEVQLAFAAIADDTEVLRWDGRRFVRMQTLGGPGGREFASVAVNGTHYLAHINFIEGTPKAPKTDLTSIIHRWTGDHWEQACAFPTFGATDAAFFSADGRTYLVVANSLTPEVRFRQDSIVYEFLG